MKEIFSFFHTVRKLQKFTLTEKKFRQINYLVISLVKTLLSRNFCQKWVRVNFRSFRTRLTLWKNEKFSLTEKKFRQITYLVIYLVKPMLSRNFCEKSVIENFCNFHTVQWRANAALCSWKIFREINYMIYHWMNQFHEIFEKESRHDMTLKFCLNAVHSSQCGNCRNSLSHIFRKNSWKQWFY